jgi:hypothetical protein
MGGDLNRHRVGSYGAGVLWCIRRQGTLLLQFNDTPIARRAKNGAAGKNWMALDRSWIVKSLGGAKVLVQQNGSGGVIVSLHGGNQRSSVALPVGPLNRMAEDQEPGQPSDDPGT